MQKVQVWIYRQGAQRQGPVFLLLQTTPERGQFWQPVTGSVEAGEALIQAASREASEETGLAFAAPPVSLDHFFKYKARSGHDLTEHAFYIEAQVNSPVSLDPREHVAYRWVTADEAFELLGFESNAEVLRMVLKKLNE